MGYISPYNVLRDVVGANSLSLFSGYFFLVIIVMALVGLCYVLYVLRKRSRVSISLTKANIKKIQTKLFKIRV